MSLSEQPARRGQTPCLICFFPILPYSVQKPGKAPCVLRFMLITIFLVQPWKIRGPTRSAFITNSSRQCSLLGFNFGVSLSIRPPNSNCAIGFGRSGISSNENPASFTKARKTGNEGSHFGCAVACRSLGDAAHVWLSVSLVQSRDGSVHGFKQSGKMP